MQLPPDPSTIVVEIGADEMLLLLAYRRCTPWRQTAVRLFAQALSEDDSATPGGMNIPLPTKH